MTLGKSREKTGSSLTVDHVLNDISEDGRKRVMIIRDDLEKLKKNFSDQLKDKNAQIETLKDEIEDLRRKVSKLEEKIDDAKAYERRDVLVFSSGAVPAVEAGETCTTIVCNLMWSKLKLEVSPSHI